MARRVAYILKVFPRISESFITNEIRELRRNGIDVRVVSLRASAAPLWSEVSEEAGRTHYLPVPGWGLRAIARVALDHAWVLGRHPRHYRRALRVLWRRKSITSVKHFLQAATLARWCRREHVSHLHAGFAHVPTSLALWVHRLTGLPYSFSTHAKDLYLHEPRSLREKMDHARFVATCTEANGRYLNELGSDTRVFVNYHGIDVEFFRPQSTPDQVGLPDRFHIVAVARHVPKKGLDILLRACADLVTRIPGLRVSLVGDGPERQALEALASSLGITGWVHFIGSVPPEQVRSWYARASVVTLPSIVLENGDRDGIPNVLVEAMACGIPVVATSASAIPELIQDRTTGLLVEQGNPRALATALWNVYTFPLAAAHRAATARTRLLERFDVRRQGALMAARILSAGTPSRVIYVSADSGVPVRGHKGASAHVRQVVDRFERAGVSVRLLTAEAGPAPPEGNVVSVEIEVATTNRVWERWLTRLPSHSTAWVVVKELRRLAANAEFARRVGQAIRHRRADFVYERYSLCAFGSGWAARRAGVPWLLEVNAPLATEDAASRRQFFQKLTRALERRILRSADHVFVVSSPLRRWALGLGVHPDRVSVLTNGVDLDRFHPRVEIAGIRDGWGCGPDDVVVAFAGSLRPWHGVRELMKACVAARERHASVHLVLIGKGEETRPLRKWAAGHGLEAFVHFTGAVPQDRVPALLRASDILVAPYLERPDFYFSPLKIMEYLAVGRPIIASEIGDISDWIDDEVGRLVPPGSVAALARQIVDLAADSDLRDAMGAAAASRVKREDWTDRVTEILRRVDRLCATSGTSPVALAENHESLEGAVDVGYIASTETDTSNLRIGYILKMFPRFSETFVLSEILELERQGVEVRTFSMKLPTGPRQRGVERVRALQTVLPSGAVLLSARAMWTHFRVLARRPAGYVETLRFALTRRDLKALVKFGQAVTVADCALRENIKHFHAHFASGPTRVAKMASMISGIPYSFTAHAKDLYHEGHKKGANKKLKKRVQRARFLVTISEENKRFIESQGFKVKEGRIRPIHIGLNLRDFPFTAVAERPRGPRPLVFAVGRLIPKKGFADLVRAAQILKARDVSFRCLIAGEGPEDSVLRALIADCGVSDGVRLLGSVPLSRLRRTFYRRAAVLVQPCVVSDDGDRDGIPTVLLEAMAMGVPVISTPVSGIPEAVTHRHTGLLAQPGSPEDLADAIEELLTDRTLAHTVSVNGRRKVEEEFDIVRNAGALRKLFLRSALGWPPPGVVNTLLGGAAISSVDGPEPAEQELPLAVAP